MCLCGSCWLVLVAYSFLSTSTESNCDWTRLSSDWNCQYRQLVTAVFILQHDGHRPTQPFRQCGPRCYAYNHHVRLLSPSLRSSINHSLLGSRGRHCYAIKCRTRTSHASAAVDSASLNSGAVTPRALPAVGPRTPGEVDAPTALP